MKYYANIWCIPPLGLWTLCPTKMACENNFFDKIFDSQLLFVSLHEETIDMDNELFSPEEMQSPFDVIKETDTEGREWWNSRKLAQIDAMVDTNNYDKSYESTQFRIWARGVLKEEIK